MCVRILLDHRLIPPQTSSRLYVSVRWDRQIFSAEIVAYQRVSTGCCTRREFYIRGLSVTSACHNANIVSSKLSPLI